MNVDNTSEPCTVLSFCSGYGGLEIGLDLAGVKHRVLAYVEIEAYAIANLVAKMESGQLDAAPIYTDLKTFPAHLFRGAVDIITGGYPCQPFSAAGKRLGADDPRHLWPFILEHINTIRPQRCFFENVEGHISLGLREVVTDLEEAGYSTTWGIFSAAEVGAPHQRKRVYILGNSKSERWREAGKSGTRPSIGTTSTSSTSINVANTCSPRLQGRSEAGNIGGETSQPLDEQSTGRSATPVRAWPVEPDVGRVVDGCADRVDRIRLLGNGVVPATAAKAYKTLTGEIT